MLVLPELGEQGEKNMQTLDRTLIVGQFVGGYVEHATHKSCVVCCVHVNLGAWEFEVFDGLFQLRVHFTH